MTKFIYALLMDEIPGFYRSHLVDGKIVLTTREISTKNERVYTYKTVVYGDVGNALGPLAEYLNRHPDAAERDHTSNVLLIENGNFRRLL